MKHSIITAIIFGVFGSIACTENTTYKITGTVENAQEGDTVVLQEAIGGELSPIEFAIIRNGVFTFQGKQDSTVNRYITCKIDNREYMADFFLENGNINVNITKETVSTTGTTTNNIHQKVRETVEKAISEINHAYALLRDTTLTDIQRKEAERQVKEKEEAYYQTIKECTKAQISNLVGVSLFKQMYRNNTLEENDTLLQKIPQQYQNDQTILKIKERVENEKNTAIGKKIVDFELQTPEGETKKLSDFIGQGKIILLDFWASWCGPCRKEMPTLVDIYHQHKNSNLIVIGISLDEDKEDWKEAIKQLNIEWIQLSDLKGWKCEAAKLYSVHSIPYTVLIDSDGTIIDRGLRGENLRTKLTEIIKE